MVQVEVTLDGLNMRPDDMQYVTVQEIALLHEANSGRP